MTHASHTFACSSIAARRARTSSERFVSCVDRVVMVDGQAALSVSQKLWNASTDTPTRVGSLPTSLTPTNRFQR